MENRDWDRLIRQLNDGRVAPFLGAGACHGTLETAGALAAQWAAEYDYPFEDPHDLTRVMRYVAVTEEDLTYVKEEFLRRHFSNITAPTDPDDPHNTLARFPLPLYLTTNYDNLLMRALSAAGREPRRVLCPWYELASYDPDAFVPPSGGSAADEPVVYHLHGHDGDPRSLVLTEDDYIQFLVALIEDRNKEEDTSARASLIPPAVQEALATRPLLFVGYSLRDWTFQVLLQGIVKGLPTTQRRSHISVQMLPLPHGATDEQRDHAKNYLDRYFADLKVSVYWGSAKDFFRELNRRAGGAT